MPFITLILQGIMNELLKLTDASLGKDIFSAIADNSSNTLSLDVRAKNLANDINYSLADNTHIAYKQDWKLFESYCRMYNHESLPASPCTVAEFIANVRTSKGEKYRPASLQRFVVSIRKKHKALSLTDPTTYEGVKRVLSGRRRSEDREGLQAKAMQLSELSNRLKILHAHKTNKALRDSLVLILGFGGAFRRSELSALKVSDITFTDFGFSIFVRKSKRIKLAKD